MCMDSCKGCLQADGKAQLIRLCATYQQASFAGIHAHLLCPFVAEGMKDELADALQNDYHKVMFSEYQPELTDSDCNAKQYKNVIARYIAD